MLGAVGPHAVRCRSFGGRQLLALTLLSLALTLPSLDVLSRQSTSPPPQHTLSTRTRNAQSTEATHISLKALSAWPRQAVFDLTSDARHPDHLHNWG